MGSLKPSTQEISPMKRKHSLESENLSPKKKLRNGMSLKPTSPKAPSRKKEHGSIKKENHSAKKEAESIKRDKHSQKRDQSSTTKEKLTPKKNIKNTSPLKKEIEKKKTLIGKEMRLQKKTSPPPKPFF